MFEKPRAASADVAASYLGRSRGSGTVRAQAVYLSAPLDVGLEVGIGNWVRLSLGLGGGGKFWGVEPGGLGAGGLAKP